MTIILTGRAARPQRGGLSLYPLPYRWKLRRIFSETGQDSGFDAALASRIRHTIRNGYMELLLIKLFLTPLLMLTISWSTRRWGPEIGGLLAGLPLTSGPISIYLW
jgi:hypothetical protein